MKTLPKTLADEIEGLEELDAMALKNLSIRDRVYGLERPEDSLVIVLLLAGKQN